MFRMHIYHNGSVRNSTKKTGHGLKNMTSRAIKSNLELHIDEQNNYFLELSGKIL